ncbi:hypothetical protein EGJ28_16525 [Stutzerimonas xanthomarina]|uniref:Uncharacterized protein n=1 Tax=Stutzerimonas xanthomarina TaxID=271420 RepID=A0A3R8V144_9GAMM|nr:hypothetical protein [Stutzerimonas xanthomarina]RRV08868.1 hypothetical protein EGJ28_16525 [Stutzerimonas xanthomarina]
MNLYEAIVELGDHLLECEVRLLTASHCNKLPDFSASQYCSNLAGTISALPHLGDIARSKAALGIANTFCPLHDKGIGDGLIADALKLVDRDGLHGKLLDLMRVIRLQLVVVEQTSALDTAVARALAEVKLTVQAEQAGGAVLDQLIDEWVGHIGRGMKAVDVEAKLRFLASLGVKPEAILKRVCEPGRQTPSRIFASFDEALQAITETTDKTAITGIIDLINQRFEAGTMDVTAADWARLSSAALAAAAG